MSIKAAGEKGLFDYLLQVSGLRKSDGISDAFKDMLELYGDANKKAGEEAFRIKDMLISGNLKDFTQLPPVDGLTILILASILDGETSIKAREWISFMNSEAGKARAANDESHQRLNIIMEKEWEDCSYKQLLIDKKRGHRTKFIQEIAAKYLDIPIKSIEGRVDKKIKEEATKKENL